MDGQRGEPYAGRALIVDAEPRRAIVTGADSGIGRAVAVALAAEGVDVAITWHSDAAGAEETGA